MRIITREQLAADEHGIWTTVASGIRVAVQREVPADVLIQAQWIPVARDVDWELFAGEEFNALYEHVSQGRAVRVTCSGRKGALYVVPISAVFVGSLEARQVWLQTTEDSIQIGALELSTTFGPPEPGGTIPIVTLHTAKSRSPEDQWLEQTKNYALGTLYFTTDRKLEQRPGFQTPPSFGPEPDSLGQLAFGKCQVAVPHNLGEWDLKASLVWKADFRPELRVEVCGGALITEAETFFREIAELLQSPGYLVLVLDDQSSPSFHSAMLSAGRRAYEFRNEGIVVVYYVPHGDDDHRAASPRGNRFELFRDALSDKTGAKVLTESL